MKTECVFYEAEPMQSVRRALRVVFDRSLAPIPASVLPLRISRKIFDPSHKNPSVIDGGRTRILGVRTCDPKLSAAEKIFKKSKYTE